jgi:hypothetical protein
MKPSLIVLDMDDVLNKMTAFAAETVFGVKAACGGNLDWYNPSHGWDIVSAVNEALEAQHDCVDTSDWGFPEKFSPWGVSEFWEEIPSDFWEEIPRSEELSEILDICLETVGSYDKVVIATSPTLDSDSLGSKYRWIRNQLPVRMHREYSITPVKKHYGLIPGALLIDDRQDNCIEFQRRGGRAIVWPKPWNLNRDIKDRSRFLRESMESFR